MAVRNPSYIIEIETHLTDIKDQIKKYETDLQRLQKTTKDMGFGENISKDIQEAIDKLNKLQSEYIESVKKFSEAKLDTGEFDKFTKSFDSQMETISARMADTEKSISELSQKLSSFKGGDALQKQVEGMRRQMKNFMSDMKNAIIGLKEFQDMVGQSFGGKELSNLAKVFKSLERIDLFDMNGIKGNKKQLSSLQNDLTDTYVQFKQLKEIIDDKSSSPSMIKNAEVEMGKILPKMAEIAKTIAKINGITADELFDSGYSFKSVFGEISLDKVINDIDSETDRLKKSLSARSEELQKQLDIIEGATTKGSTFTFKDGGITIPVILDPNSKDFLENETKKLVESLNKYAQSNPVDVVYRLFPMSGTRNEENNLAKTIKDIRAQIPKTEDKELQGQLDSFVNNLESQYRQAIKVRIAVELSETADDVVADIEKIREAARKANITISPHFEVSEEESANLKKQLEKVQDDFSFDATKKITAMSESLNKLLSTTNIKDWSEAFTKALEQVANKLEPMRDLIQPLADLTVSQKIKNGRGRPSKETVENRSYVESFYSALNALNKALAEKKKIESNAKELIPDIQSDIDKSGKSVLIPVKPNVKGFVEEIQDAINKEGVSVNVGQVSSNSGGINPIRPIDNSSISKGSSTKNDTQESKSQVQDIKDAVVAKEEKNKVSEEELELQKEFNEVLDKYIQLSIEHERAMVAKKDKKAGQLNMSKWQLIEAYPELKAFDYHDTSKLTRENLFSGYYKRKTGKTRDIHNYSWDSQYEYVQNLIKKRGKFSVSGKENADNKKALEEYVNWFRQYQGNGGTKPLIGLTKDKRIQKNLEKEYERQSKAIEKNTTKIKENEDIKKDIVDNSPTIKKETIEIEENNKKKEENIQIVKEGESGDNKNQADAQKLLDNLLAEANARNKVAEAAKEESKEINNSNQEKNNNNVNWEDTFDLWKKHVKDNGGFNLRTKDGKKKLNHAVNAYMQYKANNGTRDITELSDDKATQEKLKKAYDDATSSIKKQAETKKENINSTEGLIQKHNELKQKMNEFQNQVLNGDKDAVQKMVDTSKEIMEVRDKLEESGLIWSESESKFIQTKEQGREVGEAIVNGLKEQVPKIEEAGKEAGSAGAEGAAEGTAETQKSNSPSKVAEALGGDWGKGYANGILKSKEEVEAAVRDLVASGKMTAEEIIKDLPNIGSEEKYKDLLEPATKVGSEMLNYKPDKKTISSLKGQITKIGNQIANDPNIDAQKYAELAKRAEEYVNRLKRLGVETSEIEQKFKDITETTYQKFKPIDTSESVEAVDKEAEKLEEIPESAKKASKSKEEFADANKQVLSSIVESLKGLDAEGNGFANLNKLINNLSGKSGGDKLQKTVEGLKAIYDVLNQDVSDNALIKALTDLASKGTDLENLATILKASKKQITTAKKELDTSNQDNLKSIMESVDVSENARNYLSEYGEVVNLTQELKNGFIQVTSTVLAADDTFKRYTLTTKDGVEMTISKTEEHTTGLEKEINLYAKLLRAANRLNALDEPNPRSTDEVFIEKDSALWNDVLEYAKEYGKDLGNILSITRSVREANGEMLESFKIVGENGSVTIGAENDVVGSIQKIQDATKQYKELLDLRNKLSITDLKNTQKESFTPEYISQIREMINLIDSAEFDLTNPADVARLEKMVADAKELDVASKNMDNTLGNMKQLDKLRGKIADILNDYGAMPRELKDNFNSLKSTVEYFIKAGRISSAQADEINAKFLELNANLSESGKKYQSLGRQMLERLRSQSSQLLAQYFSFQDFIRYGRTAISTILDLDTQLVDLRKTTKMNNTELEDFYRNAADVAKEMGVTTSEIISQASAWSRLGYNTKEASTQMAKLSSQFASISPGVSTDEAQTGLVSIMKAWDVDVDRVSRDIMDNINTLGNNFALTNGDIITGMEKAGATLSAIGTSIQDSFALFTGAQEVLQNAETVGVCLVA